MKHKFTIVETYWKELEVKAGSEEKAKELVKVHAKKMNLGKRHNSEKGINFAKDILLEGESSFRKQFWKIAEETEVNHFQQMQPWQRKELAKEELFQYAEQMRLALDRIFDLAYEYERRKFN